MKKFLALVLALIMTFSLASVAFATDAAAPEVETTVAPVEGEEEGALDWILDLPVWTLGPAAKVTKIALKLVKVVVKIAIAFGIIDTDEIIQEVIEMIMNSNNPSEEATTAPAADAA